jgi:hypothetical protein
MNTNNLSRDLRFNITNLREIYESNNNLLINITHITNQNFRNNNITSLVDNLIATNNEILNTIMNLTNQHILNNNNTRQQHNNNNNNNNNNRQQNNNNNRQQNNNNNNRQQNNNNNNRQQNNNNTRQQNRENYLNNPTITNLFHTFFDPIEIYPTPYQIEVATRVARFGDIANPLNLACPISLENFNENDQVLVIRHCNHIFSNTGLHLWFRTNCRCPVCRYDIRDHVSNNAINISSLSSNIDMSSNLIPSSFNTPERTSRSNSSSTVLIDLLFSNLIDPPIATDISGNNLLQFLFRP